MEQSNESLAEEIRKASAVCIVYSVEDDPSIERITSHWLPFIRSSVGEDEPRKPVVLVGNKIDLVDYSTIDVSKPEMSPGEPVNYRVGIFQHVLSIMEEFPEIESCVECSAKTLHNITEMFYYAQKAVLHPTAPLYNIEEEDVSFAIDLCITEFLF